MYSHKQLLMFVLCCIAMNAATAQMERMEPPFWWANMQMDTIQLLCYGKNIAQWQPEIKGEVLVEAQRVQNPNYLFLTLNLASQAPGNLAIAFHKKGAPSFRKNFEIKERSSRSIPSKSFDASDVIYLLMPDRFANGNPENDNAIDMREKVQRNLPGGRHGGDLKGIIDHLDYLNALGVTALWSTPLCEDNQPQGTYHGYAQTDVYRIDPRFGSNKDYKKLADALHQRGMKLIMDYVTNHWGTQHWILQDLPEPGWIHQFEKYTQTNHRKEIFSDPYAANVDREEMTSGWFVPTMVDLNQSHPLFLQYLKQNALWWIEYAGIDGFRIDTYPYNDPEPMGSWIKAIKNEYPYFNIVGEAWVESSIHSAYWQKDSPLAAIQGFNAQLPGVMDFSLFNALKKTFSENNSNWEEGTTRIYKSLQNDFLYADVNNLLIFAENHDTKRINHRYPDFKDYQRMLTVLLTLRGIPQILYGSEIGMRGGSSQSHPDIRRDFPGGWATDQQNAFLPNTRTAEQQKYFDFTQRLLQWRKNKPAIHFGKTLHFYPQNDLYVYFRYIENETVMVVVNNHAEDQKLNASRYVEGIKHFTRAKEVVTNTLFDFETPIYIPAKTAYLLELF